MCPPAAMSMLLRELGPIVPLGVWWVVCAFGHPGVAVLGTDLVVVNCTSCLHRGWEMAWREGAWHWWWGQWLWGEGVFCRFCHLLGEGAEAVVVTAVMFGEVGVVDGAVIPKVRVPLQQDAAGVMTVDMWGWAPATPMSHLQAVKAEPLCCGVRTHHVVWTTPLDDNCRWAVDGT
jgi:hypothetical protein